MLVFRLLSIKVWIFLCAVHWQIRHPFPSQNLLAKTNIILVTFSWKGSWCHQIFPVPFLPVRFLMDSKDFDKLQKTITVQLKGKLPNFPLHSFNGCDGSQHIEYWSDSWLLNKLTTGTGQSKSTRSALNV